MMKDNIQDTQNILTMHIVTFPGFSATATLLIKAVTGDNLKCASFNFKQINC